jgi:hypothetical protein
LSFPHCIRSLEIEKKKTFDNSSQYQPRLPRPLFESDMSSLSTLGGFTAGALAACGAVTVTNPMEVVKTRLQLQGELAAKGQVKKIYTGVFQALRIIAVNEGIKGKHPTCIWC